MPHDARQRISNLLESLVSRGVAAAADHPVEVTRRDGESLVLMSESENRARNSLLELAAQLIVVSTSLEGTLAERLSDHFPWMLAAKAWRLATETIGLPAQLDEFAIPTIGLAAVTRNIHLVRPHAGISSAR